MTFILISLTAIVGLVVGLLIGSSMEPHHDEQTPHKVRDALYRAGLVKSEVEDAMIEMQKSGVIFRERR